jgi:hypothetical protein
MMKRGERNQQIAEQSEAREGFLSDIKALGTRLKKRESTLLKEKAKLENPGNLKNLTVTWEQDGEEMKIGPLEEATPVEFLRAVDSIPRSVKSKLDGPRIARLETIRGELNQIPRDYKARRKILETNIYHCDERLAKLKEGATP